MCQIRGSYHIKIVTEFISYCFDIKRIINFPAGMLLFFAVLSLTCSPFLEMKAKNTRVYIENISNRISKCVLCGAIYRLNIQKALGNSNISSIESSSFHFAFVRAFCFRFVFCLLCFFWFVKHTRENLYSKRPIDRSSECRKAFSFNKTVQTEIQNNKSTVCCR